MIYMLDTNTISEILRNRAGRAAERFRQVPRGSIATSIVVSAELRFGYRKAGSEKLESAVESFLAEGHLAPRSPPETEIEGRFHERLGSRRMTRLTTC